MILFTTSRKPSKNTRRLARAFSCFIPKSDYLTRGKRSIKELCTIAKENGFEKLCIFQERYGNPGSMVFYNLEGSLEKTLIIKGFFCKRFRKKQGKIWIEGERASWFRQTFLIKEIDKNARAKIVSKKGEVRAIFDNEEIFCIKWGDKCGDSKRGATAVNPIPEPSTTTGGSGFPKKGI